MECLPDLLIVTDISSKVFPQNNGLCSNIKESLLFFECDTNYQLLCNDLVHLSVFLI